jgi:O-methyltransferase domain
VAAGGGARVDAGGVLARGELYYRPAAGMLAAVREGGTAFEQVYGDRFFEYLSRNPEQEAIFQGSMTGRSEDEAGHVVAAYDFGGLGRLVDVGGGHGILLGAILRSAPDLRAVLVDQPAVVEQARRRLAADGVADRCELVAGDFFGDLPAGPTPTCSRGCCTTGPTATPAASWAPAARPCRPAAAC